MSCRLLLFWSEHHRSRGAFYELHAGMNLIPCFSRGLCIRVAFEFSVALKVEVNRSDEWQTKSFLRKLSSNEFNQDLEVTINRRRNCEWHDRKMKGMQGCSRSWPGDIKAEAEIFFWHRVLEARMREVQTNVRLSLQILAATFKPLSNACLRLT